MVKRKETSGVKPLKPMVMNVKDIKKGELSWKEAADKKKLTEDGERMNTVLQPSLETLIVVVEELLMDMGETRLQFLDRVDAVRAEITALQPKPTALDVGLSASS